MSFLVTITFDLSQAPTSVYPKIQKALEEIDFSRFKSGKRHQDTPLPGNTFVAEFDEDEFDDNTKSSDVSNYAKSEIERIFKEHKVTGRYFVAAGKSWAWKIGTVSP